MKTYKIPCTWQMYGFYHIEAENIKEALQIAEDSNLPEGEYIEGSFEIDLDMIRFHNQLDEEKSIVI